MWLFSFNSNLVRLRESRAEYNSKMVNSFQFQSGAIKSEPSLLLTSTALLFQFQSGAIKSKFKSLGQSLKDLFQFQSGAIKRL